MSDYLLGESANLYDPVTGAWMGIVDKRGKEQPVFSADGSAVLNPLTGVPISGGGPAVINDLTTGGTTSALSAQMGVTLKGLVDAKAAKTQTECGFSFAIDTVANQDYTIILRAPHAGTITETSSKCTSGTATATFKIGSKPLGGTANAVSSSQVNQAQDSANTFAAGDLIQVTMSANSACLGAVFSVKYTRTLA